MHMQHVAVVGTVNAGHSYTFQFYSNDPIHAPNFEGTYESRWRVWRDGNWSGPEVTIRFDVRIGGGTRPSAPTPSSPGNWYVSRDGSAPQLCVNAMSGVDYDFQIYESHDTPDSGWISSNCWTPSGLGPYTYKWHVKVRSSGLESDWSESWNFSIDSQQMTMDDFLFATSPVYDPADVRIYMCVRGFGGIGLGLSLYANTANDGSANGEWKFIPSNGTFCFDQNDASTWPEWSTRGFEDGPHRIMAVGYHGSEQLVKTTVYTLPHRAPSDTHVLTPTSGGWVNSQTVTFSWDPALRATSYRLLVGFDYNSLGALVDQTFDANTRSFTFTFDQPYSYLYAQVLAINEIGQNGGHWPFGIDTEYPDTAVIPLPATTFENQFSVTWGGTDNASGIRWYDMQYRDGNRPDSLWTDWMTSTSTTAALFNGQPGHTYYFRARALDNAGNLEPYPSGDGDAVTSIDPASRPPAPWWASSYAHSRRSYYPEQR